MKHQEALSNLAQVDIEVHIGQTFPGNEKEAETLPQRIFRGNTGKPVIAAPGGSPQSERNGENREGTGDYKLLKLIGVTVFGTVAWVLLVCRSERHAFKSIQSYSPLKAFQKGLM